MRTRVSAVLNQMSKPRNAAKCKHKECGLSPTIQMDQAGSNYSYLPQGQQASFQLNCSTGSRISSNTVINGRTHMFFRDNGFTACQLKKVLCTTRPWTPAQRDTNLARLPPGAQAKLQESFALDTTLLSGGDVLAGATHQGSGGLTTHPGGGGLLIAHPPVRRTQSERLEMETRELESWMASRAGPCHTSIMFRSTVSRLSLKPLEVSHLMPQRCSS